MSWRDGPTGSQDALRSPSGAPTLSTLQPAFDEPLADDRAIHLPWVSSLLCPGPPT